MGLTGSIRGSDVMNSKAIERYWLSVYDEDSAVGVYPAADVWVRRLVDGAWFLQDDICL